MLITTRPEGPDDLGTIRDINDRAFGQANEGHLVDALRKTDEFLPELSIVGTGDGQACGHILLYPIDIVSENDRSTALSLGPMAVLPEYQGKGIGSALVRTGLDKAANMEFECVVVVGHSDYYPRFGFVPASQFGIEAPFPVDSESFMVTSLREDGLVNARGMVDYPEVFLQAG